MKEALNQWLAFLDMERLEENATLASARAKGEEKGMREGIEKGMKYNIPIDVDTIEKGMKECIERGSRKQQEKMARKLLEKKMPIEEIIEITGLSKEEIEKLK